MVNICILRTHALKLDTPVGLDVRRQGQSWDITGVPVQPAMAAVLPVVLKLDPKPRNHDTHKSACYFFLRSSF